MAGQDITGQFDKRRHLGFGKWPVAEFMARIDQFYTDGPPVDVGLPPPAGHPGMPGPFILGDQGMDGAVFVDHIVGADLGRRVAQALQRRLGTGHAGIMQHQHIDRDAFWSIVEIRRPGFDHDTFPLNCTSTTPAKVTTPATAPITGASMAKGDTWLTG